MTIVASNYARVQNDLYQTEPWATYAALKHFPVRDLYVWEPAAGNHLMADVLRECGAHVITSDIAVYDRQHHYVFDFLQPYTPPVFETLQPDAIITNPPYGPQNRDAAKFARLALQRCDGFVMLLLTAKFDSGNTRTDLFRDNPRFIAKIVLIDRIQWFPGATSGTEDHAWYVWGPSDDAAPRFSGPRIIYEGKQ